MEYDINLEAKAWYRSKVLSRRINAALVVEAMNFFERGYLTKKSH